MPPSPSPTLKHPKSIVVAFHKLLKAAHEKSDVLFLDKRDQFANRAVQEYNDALSDTDFKSDYARYVDRLAATFSHQEMSGQVGTPKMPSLAQLEKADRILSSLLDNGNESQ
jgi:hypothetical protein